MARYTDMALADELDAAAGTRSDADAYLMVLAAAVLRRPTTPGVDTDEFAYAHEGYCNADRKLPVGCDGCSCRAGREIKRLRALATPGELEIEQMRSALKPFAEVADDFDADGRDMADNVGIYANTAGDFRRARAALAAAGDMGEPVLKAARKESQQ